MRATLVGWLARARRWGLAAALVLIAAPAPVAAASNDPSPAGEAQKQAEGDRCQFLMDKMSATVVALNPEGDITFLNHYGRNFFGYSAEDILGKPMLGTLTPPAGFEGRDLAAYMAGLLRDPNRYAFSVNQNIRRDGERVWILWANKGIYGERGEVREVLRVGLDFTDRKRRLEAAAQELRGIGEMLEGRAWVQRKKLKEITGRIEAIAEDLERPWAESKSGAYESVAPPKN
jgi:PAS domain S-box-containing protein